MKVGLRGMWCMFSGDAIVDSLTTLIHVFVNNDNQPKEYIFGPGSRPQWEAQKGFDILVGNAAGIEFDFNGKLKRNFGGEGKVVRIRLPEDFKADSYEE